METPPLVWTQEEKAFNLEESLKLLGKELGLKKKKPIPLPPNYEIIANLANKYTDPRDWLTYSWLYLTGQRISEALQTRREHVIYRENGGRPIFVVDSITLKNRSAPRRNIPVPLHGLEKDWATAVWESIKDLRPDVYIIPFTRQQARNHLAKATFICEQIQPQTRERFDAFMAMYPHFLRHCRATHLVAEHDFDNIMLMQHFGWASSTMPNVYAAANWRRLAKGFIHP